MTSAPVRTDVPQLLREECVGGVFLVNNCSFYTMNM